MSDRVIWKAEVEFEGTPEQLEKLAEALKPLPVTIHIPEWQNRPKHLAGCYPFPIDKIILKEQVEKWAAGRTRLPAVSIKDIIGGIRTPHMHIGDGVILIDKEQFRDLAGSVARELAVRRAAKIDDYIGVMDAVNRLGDGL